MKKRLFHLALLLLAGLPISAQNGVTWSATNSIAANHFGNMHPRVVTDGSGDPVVIWGSSSNKRVYFSRWTGAGFSAPVKLNPDSIPVFAASWAGPDIAAHGDTVYVVFKETPEDVNGIYLVRSFDGGLNFSAPVRVDAIADSISRFPSVGTDAAGNPLVAFMKFDPGWSNARYVLGKSSDFGNSFGADQPASGFSGGNVCDCCPAAVVSEGNAVAVLYRDNLNNLRNSWAGISIDGGETFPAGIRIDGNDWNINACPSTGPDGVILGDTLYSVFMSAASGKALVYRSRSSINGLQMISMEPVTGNFTGLGQQNFPRIAAAGNSAAAVWKQTVNGSAELAIQFTQNIQTGFPAGYDVLAANNVENADVAMVNGKVFVVWESVSDGTVKYRTGTFTVSGLPQVSAPAPVLRISPNPVSGNTLTVSVDGLENQQVRYTVYEASGTALRQKTTEMTGVEILIEVADLPAGFYWISLEGDGKYGRASFVRQ